MFRKKASMHPKDKNKVSYTPYLGFIFLVFGGIFLGKLLNWQFKIWNVGSETIYQLSFVEWVVAIGCFFGGAYMLYMSLTMRRIYIR